MKNLIYLLVLLPLSLFAQNGIQWTDPIDVASSSFGNDYPRIVLNGAEEPLITWGGAGKVYFSKLNSDGFTAPLQLNNDSTFAYVAEWTGAELTARNDTVYACFMHQQWGKKSYIVSSFDSGVSFENPKLIENYPNHSSRFPMVTIDKAGHPLVGIMKMDNNGHNPNYVVRKSVDFGNSFTHESTVGAWSNSTSHACDCCPATIKSDNEKVAVFYRDDFNNVRDIWATMSFDEGNSFSQGFAVDDSNWQLFSCPASGPDGVIIDDTLYTVFLSASSCYLSKSSISNGALVSVTKLGELPASGNQNYPRIDQYQKQVVITWRGFDNWTKLYLSYTPDITSGTPFLQDTVYLSPTSTADVALGSNGIHLAIEDLDQGSVKYMRGSLFPTSTQKIEGAALNVFPNPTSSVLHIENFEAFDNYTVYAVSGEKVKGGKTTSTIELSELDNGTYILELLNSEKQVRHYQKIIIQK